MDYLQSVIPSPGGAAQVTMNKLLNRCTCTGNNADDDEVFVLDFRHCR